MSQRVTLDLITELITLSYWVAADFITGLIMSKNFKKDQEILAGSRYQRKVNNVKNPNKVK